LYTAQKATVIMRRSPTQTKVSSKVTVQVRCLCHVMQQAESSRDTVQRRKNFGPALGQLGVNIKGQSYHGQKTWCVLPSPPRQHTNGMRSLQTTSSCRGRDHSVTARGNFGGLRAICDW